MPLITLTTDFGLQDHYVGSMKGVILSRCPRATIVDICHDVAAFSIWSGAYTIDQAAPYFPAGTFHVVVIDPGVGTDRKPILVEALGQYFIAPDNGVLSLIRKRETGHVIVREIANPNLLLSRPSATFHGRDVFAPAAAALAARTILVEQVGPLRPNLEILNGTEAVETSPQQWAGAVLSVDHFGNVITNFRTRLEGRFELRMPKGVVNTFRRTFHGAPPDQVFAYVGSSGYIEIGMTQRSAAQRLHLSPGDPLTLQLH